MCVFGVYNVLEILYILGMFYMIEIHFIESIYFPFMEISNCIKHFFRCVGMFGAILDSRTIYNFQKEIIKNAFVFY